MRIALAFCVLAFAHGQPEKRCSATSAAAFAQTQMGLHSYGKLFVQGLYKGIEYYRASFGGLIPCGSRDLVYVGTVCDASRLGEAVIGRFAVVSRGNCSFLTKALLAQRAGAAGVIIVNNEPGLLRAPMGNVSDGLEVVIPIVMVPHSASDLLTGVGLGGAADDERPLLHGSLGPARESCVDPQSHDEEWMEAMCNATLPRSAHPLARVAPGGEPMFSSIQLPANISPESRSPGSWPAAPTEVSTLTITVHKGEGLAAHEEATAHLPDHPAEVYMAQFGGAVLGSSRPLVWARPSNGCSAPEAGVGRPLHGAIVVVVRGECTMVHKARLMEAAGAAGVIIVNAGSGVAVAGDAPPVGVVQAIGDGEMETRPVTIPVGMVSAQEAAAWAWVAADGSAADLSGCEATWRASRASGGAWDELGSLRAKGRQMWPVDGYHRRQQLLSLVIAHHPSSAVGHGERWAHLQETAAGVQLGEELQAAVEGIAWDAAGQGVPIRHLDRPWTLDSGESAPGIAVGSPTAVNLLAGLRGTVVRKIEDGALRCRSSGGATYVAPLPGPVDPASPYPLLRRVTELLQVQACLEKTALINAAALGGYLELLRAATDGAAWPAMLRMLLGRPYGMSDSASLVAATTYIDLSRALDAALQADGEARPLGDLLGPGNSSATRAGV